ncbi:MAG: hypothetical protein AB7P04_13185 [Bacteriovoracia bacterium]
MKRRYFEILTLLWLFAGAGPTWARKPSQQETPTLEQIRTLLESRKTGTSIENLLQHLAENFPLYMSHFTLMFDSQSLQEGTPTNPRAIVYGRDANLLLSFNGHPADPQKKYRDNSNGFENLELIEFQADTHEFRFFEVTRQNGRLAISEPNPAKCYECHGQADLRPNWEPYDTWPGAFGSFDDRLYGGQPSENNGYFDFKRTNPALELSQLKEFIVTAGAHPRYRHLQNLAASYEAGRSTSFDRQLDLPRMTKVRHNGNLTTLIARKNLKRVVRLMKQTPDYAAYKYAILGAWKCPSGDHDKPWDFVPSTLVKIYPKSPYAAKNSEREEGLFKEIFERRGISIKDWSTSFRKGIPDSFNIPNDPSSISDEFAWAMAESDPELDEYLSRSSKPGVYTPWLESHTVAMKDVGPLQGCDALKAKSLSVLSKLNAVQPARALQPNASSLLQSCVRCHVNSKIGAAIAFDDEKLLGAQLQNPPAELDSTEPTLAAEIIRRISIRAEEPDLSLRRLRMPRGGKSFTAEEIDQIRTWLKTTSPPRP